MSVYDVESVQWEAEALRELLAAEIEDLKCLLLKDQIDLLRGLPLIALRPKWVRTGKLRFVMVVN